MAAGDLCGKLNMWVKGIKVLWELLAVFCLLDGNSVIHICKPNSR